VIVDVVRKEIRTIGAMLIVLSVVLVLSASLVYLAEHHVQPLVFKDIPSSLWWSVVTVTTLGYGDMVPVTFLGKVVGAVTAITGLGMIALPSGFLASGFSEQLRMRREEYRNLVDDVLDKNGQITRNQRRALDEARRSFNLTEDEAIEILRNEVMGRSEPCPHCGKPPHKHGSAEPGLDQ
jgi:voltage-gated potassium channel